MKNQENNKFLGEENINKLLLKFSIPCILSLLISSLYNIVDQIFIGNSELGYLGNAATGVVYPITIIAVAFAWCFGDGAAAYLSLCQGRGDTKNSHQGIGNSILVTFIISIIFLILGFIFKDNLLYLFGASSKSINLARDYFTIILLGIPIYMLANSMNAVIRADGSPGFSMFATLIGAVINIILDPIFIFPLHMGIKGAALATVIGQIASFIISIIYYTRTKTFKLSLSSFKINFNVFKNIIKLGISTFITQMSIVVISLVCNIMLAKYGALSKYGADIPIAVIGITMKVFSIVINIIVGIILGAQPILGYNFGAKNIDRVKETFKKVVLVSIAVGVISTLIFELCPSLIISIFGSNNELYMEFATLTFRLFLMLVVLTCLIKLTSIFFQAVGEPLKSAIVSLTRDIIFFIPLVIILPNYMGIKGVLIAAPLADFLGIIITIILVRKFFRNLDIKIIDNKEIDYQNSKEGVIITISRSHGSQGKYIGELVAKELNIPYYYKEMTALAAKESGLDKEFISNINESKDVLHDLYLTTAPVKYAIEAQEKVIKMISSKGSCVLVGRAADYVLRDNKNVIKIFIYAPFEYRVKKVMEMYKDNKAKAIKKLRDLVGIENLYVRYDPIFISSKYNLEYHKKVFAKMCNLLDGYVNKIIVSFIDEYKNVRKNKNILNYRPFTFDDYKEIGESFSKCAKSHGMTVQTCFEDRNLSEYGFIIGECFSHEMAYNMTGKKYKNWKARKGLKCNCVSMVDIGVYNTCSHLCKYCYANYNEEEVFKNIKEHDINSSLLIGNINEDDTIKVRKK